MYNFLGIFGRSRPNSREVARQRLEAMLRRDRAEIARRIADTNGADVVQLLSKHADGGRNGAEINLRPANLQAEPTAQLPVISTTRH